MFLKPCFEGSTCLARVCHLTVGAGQLVYATFPVFALGIVLFELFGCIRLCVWWLWNFLCLLSVLLHCSSLIFLLFISQSCLPPPLSLLCVWVVVLAVGIVLLGSWLFGGVRNLVRWVVALLTPFRLPWRGYGSILFAFSPRLYFRLLLRSSISWSEKSMLDLLTTLG